MNRRLFTPTNLLALSVVVAWGFSFIAIEVALRHVTPVQLVVLRFLPTLPVFLLLGVLGLSKRETRPSLRDLAGMLFSGVFVVLVYNLALNHGQTHLPASLAALVIALNPASIALIARLWLGERPAGRIWIGIFVALAGVVVIVLARHGSPEVRSDQLLGVLITLGAPLSWGIFTTSQRKYVPRYGARQVTSLSITLGSVPLLFLVDGELIDVVRHANVELIVAVAFLSFVCTVYGFTVWGVVLKKLEAAQAGLFIYLVPVVAALGSAAVLHEPLDLALILGGAVVLTGVSLATGRLKFGKKQK